MPRVQHSTAVPYLAYGEDLPEEQSPGFLSVGGAAIRQENSVYAGYKLLSQQTFPVDTTFDSITHGKKDDLWLDHSIKLARAQSLDEYNSIRQQILQEQRDRETLAAAGWGGIAAAIISGTVSPTIFIPLVGPARGAKGVAQAFALAASAATADELALLASQETRTAGEVIAGITAGTVLGGLLGSAAVHLRPAQRARLEADMARPTLQWAIHNSHGQSIEEVLGRKLTKEELAYVKKLDSDDSLGITIGRTEDEVETALAVVKGKSSIGAKRVLDEAPELHKPNFVARALFSLLARMNPVTRLQSQGVSQVARRSIFQIADAGLITTGNNKFVPHALEGTVENRIPAYYAEEAKLILRLDDAFSRHILGDKVAEEELQGASIARIKSVLNTPEGKLSWEQFSEETFLAAQVDEVHADPNIAKAAKAWEDFSDSMKEIAEEAYEKQLTVNPSIRRLFNPDGSLGPDAHKYVTHVWSPEKIQSNYAEFLRDITDHGESILGSSFQKSWERFAKKKDKFESVLAAMGLDPARARAEYEATNAQLLELLGPDSLYTQWLDEVKTLKKAIKAAEGNDQLKQSLVDELAELQNPKQMSADLLDEINEVKDLQAYQKALSQNIGVAKLKEQELVEKLDKLEELDLNNLDQLSKATRALDKKLLKLTDEKLDAATTRAFKQLRKLFDDLNGVSGARRFLDKQGTKKLTPEEEFELKERYNLLSTREKELEDKYLKVGKRWSDLKNMDRVEARELLKDLESLQKARTRDIIARRVLREEKLKEQIAQLTPDAKKAAMKELQETLDAMEEAFDNQWRERGAVDLDMDGGRADFRMAARERAEELGEKMLGLDNPIAGLEILGGKRGPELARVLNLPLEIKKKYLELDMERIARIYTRRLAPDIELYRAFGSVNAGRIFEDVKLDFQNFRERLFAADRRPAGARVYKQWLNGEEVEGGPWVTFTREEKDKAIAANLDKEKEVLTDLRVVVQRLRHQRGVPQDANSLGFRLGRMAADANVFRLMGTVVPSSFSDAGRAVMRYGFRTVFGDGVKPFFNDMTAVKLGREQGRLMGVGLDPILHNRAQAVLDLWDDYAKRKTHAERFTGFLANKTGFVAMFDRWTAEQKYLVSSITMAQVSSALRAVAGGVGIPKMAKLEAAKTNVFTTLSERYAKVLEGFPEGVKGAFGELLEESEANLLRTIGIEDFDQWAQMMESPELFRVSRQQAVEFYRALAAQEQAAFAREYLAGQPAFRALHIDDPRRVVAGERLEAWIKTKGSQDAARDPILDAINDDIITAQTRGDRYAEKYWLEFREALEGDRFIRLMSNEFFQAQMKGLSDTPTITVSPRMEQRGSLYNFAKAIVEEMGIRGKVHFISRADIMDEGSKYGKHYLQENYGPGAVHTFEGKDLPNGRATWVSNKNTWVVYMDEKLSPSRGVETVLHELGHVLHFTEFMKLAPEERAVLVNEFIHWRAKTRGDLAGRYKARTSVRGGKQYANVEQRWKDAGYDTKTDMGLHPEYVGEFAEWFADMTSRSLQTTDFSADLVGQFFSRIKLLWEKLVAFLQQSEYANPAMDDLMVKLSERFRKADNPVPQAPDGPKAVEWETRAQELLDEQNQFHPGPSKATDAQMRLLAENGIDETLARELWEQFQQPNGSTITKGEVLPNLEGWQDVRLKRAYTAAINRMVNTLIVTPGVDRPNWVDENMAFKLLAQFRSFNLTATNRVILSGAQQSDMALAQGIAFSLALGVLSYYTYLATRGLLGDEKYTETGRIMDEAIARSGLMAIFAEPYAAAQKVPGLAEHITFGGRPTSHYRSLGLIGSIGGPSVDLADKASRVILGMSEPTQSTVHAARQLGPYQNVFWFRLFVDKLEQAFNEQFNIPERRGQ